MHHTLSPGGNGINALEGVLARNHKLFNKQGKVALNERSARLIKKEKTGRGKSKVHGESCRSGTVNTGGRKADCGNSIAVGRSEGEKKNN